jgi:hypothetical protein
MRRSIGTPLALLGLLLAVAMVCTTSAQAPKPGGSAVDPMLYRAPIQPPQVPLTPILSSSGHAPLLVVGRYQAVSHNGRLNVIDTATGECFKYNGAWERFAPPIEPNAVPAPNFPTTPAPLVPGGTGTGGSN